MSRDEFLDRLMRLLPAQFEELVFRLAVPPQYLSPATAAMATRAIELLRYLENAGRMEHLASYLTIHTEAPQGQQGGSSAPSVRVGGTPANPPGAAARTQIFVSYDPQDAKWLERLKVHLKPLENQGLIELWDDTRIQPGTLRNAEIEKALRRSPAAVLLVSANFLHSDAVRTNELLPLLKRVAEDGVRILPVIAGPCLFERSGLEDYQPVNHPDRPLSSMDRDEAEKVLVKLARILVEVSSSLAANRFPVPLSNFYKERGDTIPFDLLDAKEIKANIQISKRDSILWLKDLAQAGLNFPPGKSCELIVNGMLIEFVPVRGEQPGLKARGKNAPLWNAIPYGSPLRILFLG